MADSMPKLRVAQSPSEPPKRSNALAEILYGSTADSDVGASSGDELHEAQEDGEDIPVEDAASIIGVSISEAQARLTSPRTPAIEKAAALQESGGYFSEDWITPGNGGEDGTDGVLSGPPAGEESLTAKEKPERKEDLPLPHANPPSVQQRREGLPSPWQSGLRKRDSKPDTFRDSIGGAFLQHARKSSLGEVARKFNNLNLLPSFPKNFTFSVPNLIPSIPSFDGLSASKEDGSSKPSSFLEYFPRKPAARAEDPVSRPKVLQRRSTTTALPDRTQFGPESESSQSSSTDSDTFSPLPNKLDIMNVGPLPNRSRVLTSRRGQSQSSTRRRSASLDSLSRYLDHVRNVSPIPNVNHFRRNSSVSLGDDSRFEHTQEQINNRIRAIRDTLQDHVDIRLPSLPSLPSISSFGFSSIVGASSPEAASRSHAASVAGLRSSAFQNGHHRSISDSAATSKQKAKSKVDRHPSFTQALEQLHGDVVVLGGYRGSILRSRESPKGRLWAPFKVSMGVQNVNLGLDLNHKLEETEDERIFSPVSCLVVQVLPCPPSQKTAYLFNVPYPQTPNSASKVPILHYLRTSLINII